MTDRIRVVQSTLFIRNPLFKEGTTLYIYSMHRVGRIKILIKMKQCSDVLYMEPIWGTIQGGPPKASVKKRGVRTLYTISQNVQYPTWVTIMSCRKQQGWQFLYFVLYKFIHVQYFKHGATPQESSSSNPSRRPSEHPWHRYGPMRKKGRREKKVGSRTHHTLVEWAKNGYNLKKMLRKAVMSCIFNK